MRVEVVIKVTEIEETESEHGHPRIKRNVGKPKQYVVSQDDWKKLLVLIENADREYTE